MFSRINKKIQNFIKENQILDNLNESKTINDFSILPLSDAIFCAEDSVRNEAFFEGISKAFQILDIHPSQACFHPTRIGFGEPVGEQEPKGQLIAIDAGCGIGILGIFALLIGFDKCYFLENNTETLEYCKKLVEHFGLTNQSVFVNCDAKECKLDEKYDLLISETISSGFVEEDFPFIINNLKQYGNKNSLIIPEKFEIEILSYDSRSSNYNSGLVNCHSGLDPESTSLLTLKSKDGFKRQQIQTNSKILTFITKAYIYDDIFLKTGDCMSFLNERTIDLTKNEHRLYREN